MKLTLKLFACLSSLAWLTHACTKDDPSKMNVYPDPVVTSWTPETTAATPVEPGTIVTLSGRDLDQTETVEVGGVTATIVSRSAATLSFAIPLASQFVVGEVIQTDIALYSISDMSGDKAWSTDYYVQVNSVYPTVVSVSPMTGVPGSAVLLSGYALMDVNKVLFGSVEIAKESFTRHRQGEIEVKVPSAAYVNGDNEMEIAIVWGDDNTVSSATTSFRVTMPDPEVFVPAATLPTVGAELTFTGINMDRIDSVYVQTHKAEIKAKSPTSITISVPNKSYIGAPGLISVEVNSYCGAPTTIIKLGDVDIDATEAPAPTFTAIVPTDGGPENKRYYPAKEVAVTGTQLDAIERITVGDLEATITVQDATLLTFIVPDGYTFTTMTACDVKAYTSFRGNSITVPIAEAVNVYPYYYHRNLTLRLPTQTGSGSEAILMLNQGRTISTDEWADVANGGLNRVDPFAFTNTGATSSSWSDFTMEKSYCINQNKITQAQYESVEPYLYLVGHPNTYKFMIYSPAHQAGDFRGMKDSNGNSIMSEYATGTPVVMFRNCNNGGSLIAKKPEILSATIASLYPPADYSTSGFVRCNQSDLNTSAATANKANDLTIGSVIAVQYANYSKTATANTTGNIEAALFAKGGYVIINSFTQDGISVATREELLLNENSAVHFDLIWPIN